MEQENVLTGNKLIIEFLEWKLSIGSKDEYETPFPITKWIETSPFSYNYNDKELSVEKDHRIEEMLFHKSWDWLIPVIGKIQNLDIYLNYVIQESRQFYDADITVNIYNITDTWKEVIEFIKWYNKNKDESST